MDIKLNWNDQGDADLSTDGADIATDEGLRTAIFISLFTNRRVSKDEELAPGERDRGGWWGDSYSTVPNDRIGSRLWLIYREKQLPKVVAKAEEYAREALQWLLDDKVAQRVDVVADGSKLGELDIEVHVYRPGRDVVNFRFDSVWNGELGSKDVASLGALADLRNYTPTLNLDFMAGAMPAGVTFTRASTATRFNESGVLETVGNNVPRFDYNPITKALKGLLIEDQRTNQIRNSTARGALVGRPGRTPTYWSLADGDSGASGLQYEITGMGTETGIPYIDLRTFGTASVGGAFIYAFEASNQVVAAEGETWCGSAFIRMKSGSFSGITNANIQIREGLSDTSFLRQTQADCSGLSDGPLASGRIYCVATLGASTERIVSRISGAYSSGAVIDFTLRIGLPQLELGSYPSSPMITEPTFSGRASVGTYFDASGVLQTAAAGVARFDHDPATLEDRGVLLEPSTTNYIRNNTMQGAVVGTESAGGVIPTNWTSDTTTAQIWEIVGKGKDSGIDYIDFRIHTNGANNDRTYAALFPEQSTGSGITVAASGQTWTGSIFGKYLSDYRPQTDLIIRAFTSAGVQTEQFSTDSAFNGTIVSAASLNAGRAALENKVLANATTARITMFLQFQGLPTNAPIDFTIRVGMPQLENIGYATSVIATTNSALTRASDGFNAGVAVTRAYDVAALLESGWLNPYEGTIYSESEAPSTANSLPRIWSLQKGSSSTADYIQATVFPGNATNNVGFRVLDGTTTSGTLVTGSRTVAIPTGVIKTALGFAEGDYSFAANDSAVLTASGGGLPPFATGKQSLYIGRDGANPSGRYMNGWIRKIAAYRKKLPDSVLRNITA